MNRNRILTAVVVAVLIFSVLMLGGLADLEPFLISPPTAREVNSFKSFDRCGTYGQDDSITASGDYAIEGSKVVYRGGKNYVAAEITRLLSWAAPGPVLLNVPFSLSGVTYSSPGSEAWTATYTAGFLFVTMTFADAAQRNLSVVLAPPFYNGDGCVAPLVQRGFPIPYVSEATTGGTIIWFIMEWFWFGVDLLAWVSIFVLLLTLVLPRLSEQGGSCWDE